MVAAALPSPAHATDAWHRQKEIIWLIVIAGAISIACIGIAAAHLWQQPKGFAEREDSVSSFRYGSVLFIAPGNNNCRQGVIDNETWLMQQTGVVDCDAAASQLTVSERQKWSAGRVEAIRSGLVKR